MEKKTSKIEISELFLVKADWDRTFLGKIIRETTADGKYFVRGTVVIDEGKAWSAADNQDKLADNLDDICTLKLDHNLHGVPCKFINLSFITATIPYGDIADQFFLN
jgi:hypothetical protein